MKDKGTPREVIGRTGTSENLIRTTPACVVCGANDWYEGDGGNIHCGGCDALLAVPVPGQHNHAAETEWEAIRDALDWYSGTAPTYHALHRDAIAALSSLKARHDELQEKFDHLYSEWGYGHHRGDHLVYEAEWEAFDQWQRAGRDTGGDA